MPKVPPRHAEAAIVMFAPGTHACNCFGAAPATRNLTSPWTIRVVSPFRRSMLHSFI